MTAFGPFAGTAVVDFDELGADGVFLLHGQTGAGKSTVLDAVAFALFGTVPGVRREAKRLQSDHAAATVAPQVALEATLAGRRLRIVRRPEFRRPKRRGDGERVEPARATLEWLDGSGVHLSRIPEIGDAVNALLGMSADQFFQVVLLPQGEFARFLRAENEDREALLGRLFATERFAVAEQWLADHRRASAADLADRGQQIERLVSQICQVAQTAGPDEPAGAVRWAANCLDRARSAVTEAQQARMRSDRAARQTSAAFAATQRTADAQRRAADARRCLAELAASAADHVGVADELAAARRAEPVATHIADAHDAQAAADAAARAQTAATADLTAIPGGADALDDPETAAHRWSTELGGLEALAADARRADELSLQHDEWSDHHRRLSRRRDQLVARIAAVPAELAVAEQASAEAAAAAGALAGHRVEVERSTDALHAAQRLIPHRQARQTAATRVADCRTEHADARERLLDLRERRLAGMAAELAAGLADDSPCAVCGSRVHPAPAAPMAGSVRDADERAAVRAEAAAAGALAAAVAALAELDREIEALVARCADADPGLLAEVSTAARRRLATASAAADRVDGLLAEVARLREEQAGGYEQCRAVEAELGSTVERIEANGRQIAEIRARVVAACGADDGLDARQRRLGRLIRAAGRLQAARATAATTATVAVRAAERAVERARVAGFAGSDDVAAAIRPAGRVAELAELLAVVERRRTSAEAVLAEPTVVAAAAAPEADLDRCAAAVADAERVRDTAIAVADRAEQCVRQLEELIVPLTAAVEALAPVQARHSELAEIAEVVAGRGSNSRRMTLRSYVLAARLEEVAVAASIRLRSMTDGRYEFVHSDDAGPRGRRGGLGLHVRDDYTGTIRPAKTLSGGETFIASLALALGLADTVAAESGGRVLDTLFIDEGFGSLDDTSLDAVMGVLDELRADGRVVGIVSHLDELRQRIPTRLHVVRGRNGSRLIGPNDHSAGAGEVVTDSSSPSSSWPDSSAPNSSPAVVRRSTCSPR